MLHVSCDTKGYCACNNFALLTVYCALATFIVHSFHNIVQPDMQHVVHNANCAIVHNFEQFVPTLGHSFKKKIRTSPTCSGVRAFQSCQGVWHYLWVFRVVVL